ncbi:MAG: peptidase C25 [Algoriphagus sp.]|jgi:hypothetical protein|uniref:type IX secretion system sortase PorU n=5 Tax=Algoriphagus TaxID=246875 RepID=UPI000C4CA98B|nr:MULTISPECIES: type IX secretion system sortase PorU [unclassified Algoriphagus]MAL13019.1 peptidase C25 [Algoriphagus sp.]HAD52086.1 peptidase C25 [Algoriphagus sp.]HAS57416.1 peptidase C25 [Algoriphagus sp.]HCB45737.1 peptidase C25 [Algoriphagus sp.]
MNLNSRIFFFFLLLVCSLPQILFAQSPLFKFEVTKEGIYKINPSLLTQIGAANLSEVAIYGYPGSIPQQLNNESLSLREIPTLLAGNELLVYLQGPHGFFINPENNLSYQHHIYRDTLSYLIGKKTSPKRVESISASSSEVSASTLYQWSAIKGEENNLLNSGRTWYSAPVSTGNIRSIPIRKSGNTNAAWKVNGVIMAQSLSSSELRLSESGQSFFSTQIDPIPNTTYGIKGREKAFKSELRPAGNELRTIELGLTSSDPNARAYFEHIQIGVPFSTSNLKSGVYFSLEGSSYTISDANLIVWDVSDFFQPKSFAPNSTRTITSKKIAVASSTEIPSIEKVSPISSELRADTFWPELLIITSEAFYSEAERLRTHKLSMGVLAEVVITKDIYDSFGYGNRDVVAIRDFIAYHYHKGGNLKNVLFLGKGTFDYKSKLGGRPNIVPTYSSRNSLNPLTTYSSDDFFGLVQMGQGVWEENREGDEPMQIGIGRLPVINLQEASVLINKIIQYESQPLLGDWHRNISFMADDADNNIHLRDAESHASFLKQNHPAYFQNKIYLDRFEQVRNGTTQRSPKAKEALKKTLEEGTLFLNYIGHGNETTLTAEEVFRVEDIANWPQMKHLPLWITATCEFGRHDSPFLRSSAEELLIARGKGAIGLLTTGRPVFSSVNFSLNQAFFQEVFRKEGEEFQDLGTIFKNTKNQSLNGALNRNFSLLGDPSMRLARPNHSIRLVSLKDEVGNDIEQIAPLQEVSYEAEIINASQQLVSSFSGEFEIDYRGPQQAIKTLGDESAPLEFPEESLIYFKGKGQVRNGKIQGKLLLPSLLAENFESSNLRIYAKDEERGTDAWGIEKLESGGQAKELQDEEGPQIEIQLENQSQAPFRFASTTLSAIISFTDSSGIDITGLREGKQLLLVINDEQEISLNKLFHSLSGSYTKGEVVMEISGLKEGKNSLEIKAFDLVGNGSTEMIEVLVEGSNKLQILDQKVFPNPAKTLTNFEIKHNRAGENLLIRLEIINLEGRILFAENQRLVEAKQIIGDLTWIFLQNQTKYPAKGTYIYRVTLQSELDGSMDFTSGKIVIE